MLQRGVYSLSGYPLTLNYAVTIEAEVAGTVVLDANGMSRVFTITGTGVELIGLNITGGDIAASVSVPKSNPRLLEALEPPSIPHPLAFLRPIHRPVELLTMLRCFDAQWVGARI